MDSDHQCLSVSIRGCLQTAWIPACAGMTGGSLYMNYVNICFAGYGVLFFHNLIDSGNIYGYDYAVHAPAKLLKGAKVMSVTYRDIRTYFNANVILPDPFKKTKIASFAIDRDAKQLRFVVTNKVLRERLNDAFQKARYNYSYGFRAKDALPLNYHTEENIRDILTIAQGLVHEDDRNFLKEVQKHLLG